MTRKTGYFSLATLLLTCITGWQIAGNNPIDKAEWLSGTWANYTSRGTIYESWTKMSTTEMAGKSYVLKDTDTLLLETVQLLYKNDSLRYIVTVPGQNADLPVSFSATKVTDNQLIFENPSHDFPQVISYTRIHTDSLVAEISGRLNEQPAKRLFPMKRIRH